MGFTCYRRPLLAGLLAFVLSTPSVTAAGIPLDLTSEASIKSAAATAAYGLVAWYNGNTTGATPGILPSPYYWWEAGAMFTTLIDYWYLTGDTIYNNITKEALLFQTGADNDYMPANQTKDLGNDDQGFWGLAAMEAAELGFENPSSDKPQWLALAQAVFNEQAGRWDTSTCAGGLRWQIYSFNTGYTYKNSISNGLFFDLGARLARYTGNTTYSDWAEKTWDWTAAVNLLDASYYVYDGSDDTINCTDVDHLQWTYNAGVFLHGAATMWNITSSDLWKTRVNGLVGGLSVFFLNGIMSEIACEGLGTCNNDQVSFKAYLARWMAVTTQLAPFTAATLNPLLETSATAAAQQCSGGTSGQVCGLKWIDTTTYDGTYGPGQQMAALSVIQNLLIGNVAAPLTNDTGGTSVGDSSAGTSTTTAAPGAEYTITTGDRVAAGVVTAVILGAMINGAIWMAI